MKKKVLAIDDSKALRMIVSRYLTPFGIEMLEAENGEQGLAVARTGEPNAILLDYNMPIMDGYTTLVALKEDPKLKPIPVVMLTTETVQGTVIRLIKLGIKDYIGKPFTREILLQKLNPILGLYSGNEVPPEASAADGAKAEKLSGKPGILVVDDSENILKMLKDFIGEKFQIITADCGKKALEKMKQNNFSFVFLDLGLPDMSGSDVFHTYANVHGGSGQKVVAMALRTAKHDIEHAIGQGIKNFLYKPFTRDDVSRTLELLVTEAKDSHQEKTGYLGSSGNIRILDCPAERDPKYRSFTGAMSSIVIKEIDNMAEEGLAQLIIKLGEGFLSDSMVTSKLISIVERASQLTLSIRFVADSPQEQTVLKQFAETAHIPIDSSLDFALAAIG
jgi:DNA-binding response OmpR family regulator